MRGDPGSAATNRYRESEVRKSTAKERRDSGNTLPNFPSASALCSSDVTASSVLSFTGKVYAAKEKAQNGQRPFWTTYKRRQPRLKLCNYYGSGCKVVRAALLFVKDHRQKTGS